jgi:hypothetical protein
MANQVNNSHPASLQHHPCPVRLGVGTKGWLRAGHR